jgi:hypothetical protein
MIKRKIPPNLLDLQKPANQYSPPFSTRIKKIAHTQHTHTQTHHSISSQTASLFRDILLLLSPSLTAELCRVRIPPAKANLDVIALSQVGNAPKVACQIATKYRLA